MPKQPPKPSGPAGADSKGKARAEREQRLLKLEDHIAEHLRDAEASGELHSAPSWGRPLDLQDGYALTPQTLQMPMKVLKNAGVVPHEVTMMRELSDLRTTLESTADPDLRRTLQQRASELQQSIALRLERLRSGVL
jgi:hypothetical protein